jgi:four helix bundle protein
LGQAAGLNKNIGMRDHKSLIAWQRARNVALSVVRLSREHWHPWAGAILYQLQRASLSVQLNIAEGHALKSRSRFRNHLIIAYGSAVETVELLELALDADCWPKVCQDTLAMAIESRALLLGLIKRYAEGG